MNRELVQQTRDWVAAGGDDQYEWEQDWWYHTPKSMPSTCGTTCCVAGYAVAKDPNFELQFRPPYDNVGYGDYIPTIDGVYTTWTRAGAHALGIKLEQARVVFNADAKHVLELLDALLEDENADLDMVLYEIAHW